MVYMVCCCNCANFRFEREVYLHANDAQPVTLGQCFYGNRDFGNMTLSVCKSQCKHFRPWKQKYHRGDVLKNDHETLFVVGISVEYYPRCYRVTNNNNSTMSKTAEELDEYELIMRKE